MTTRGNVYAFERAFVWRVNSSGIATGQLDPDSPGSPPLTSHAYEIHGPITATLPEPEFARFDFRGGGKFEGAADGGLQTIGTGELQVSQMDAALDALLQGGLVDTSSLVGATISSPNSLNPSPRQVGLMLIGRKQSRLNASAGSNKYVHIIYPLVQMRKRTPGLTQEAGVNPSPIRLTFQPAVATKFPNGIPFGANQGWQGYSEFHYRMTADKPYALTSWLQDGSAVTFTLGYLPTSNVVTGGINYNWVARNGAAVAPTSINTTTGVVTMSAAGTSGQYTVVMYPTDFVATP